MSTTAAPPVPAAGRSRRRLRPGTTRFTVVLALGMAVTALGIDAVLPAFPEIRQAMGLGPDSNEVAGLVSLYLLGSSVGLLPAGLLADRYGRRSVIFGGLLLYTAGAIAALFATSLGVMLVARFVWGLGSAGPRVAVLAIVRDIYAGEQMAKQMSFIMAVFILVPIFAPSLASGLLAIAPWQAIFWMCAAFGAVMFMASMSLPETLAAEDRARLTPAGIFDNCRTVLVAPGTIGHLVALTALFSAFVSYLGSSETILDQVFGLEQWFPVFFGGVALVMGISMFVNGRIVERVGLERLLTRVYVMSIPATVVLLVLALTTGGRPPFWLFVTALCLVLFCQQMLIPNLNASGMQPLAHVAGTAAAILGMVSGGLGSLIAVVIDRRFDGTVRPLSVAFVVCNVVSAAGFWWAIGARRRAQLDAAPATITGGAARSSPG